MLRDMPAGCSMRRCRSDGNGSPLTSVLTSCAIVMPPPEYSHRAPGVVSLRTAGVMSARMCFYVGLMAMIKGVGCGLDLAVNPKYLRTQPPRETAKR